MEAPKKIASAVRIVIDESTEAMDSFPFETIIADVWQTPDGKTIATEVGETDLELGFPVKALPVWFSSGIRW